MAEALSIIGAISSIAGIIDVLGKAINVIYELRNQWSEAANTVVGIVAQLVALKAALAKIKEWTESKVDEPHHQLTIDLDGSISCCKMIVERIDSWLSELQRKPNGELEVSAKFKVTLGSKSMDDLQKNLGYQVNALNLLLNACNWYENRDKIPIERKLWLILNAVNQSRSRRRFLRKEALARVSNEPIRIPRP